MNKTELIAAAAERAGIAKKDTERVVGAVLDAITDALGKQDRVQISGFGIFEVKERKARVGRNPRSGMEISIPASKQPVFKPSKALRDTVSK